MLIMTGFNGEGYTGGTTILAGTLRVQGGTGNILPYVGGGTITVAHGEISMPATATGRLS